MVAFLQYESDNLEAFVMIEKGFVTHIEYLTHAGKFEDNEEMPKNTPVESVKKVLEMKGYRLVSDRYAKEEVEG